ncbi:STAS domain-containing protein [Allonocardiopsis opalescens]|uniref:Anti-sigma factor antagonist n=1 Tax=Allonocardiopsis opalescens TaxID=1144618 RepID=A0A2T0PTE1_9ACTN|nr:STAS domain-containing protein [Allonocardiopsis opalescens]PRX92169.1 anti-anti-sigma factor [Allonocardiopsis opalescens]
MQKLGLATQAHGGTATVQVVGEVDIATAADLRRSVSATMREHGPWLVLDLTRVRFMDSSGLNVLIEVHKECKEQSGHLALAGPQAQVAKVIRLIGLDKHVAVHDTVAEAVTAVDAHRVLPAEAEETSQLN